MASNTETNPDAANNNRPAGLKSQVLSSAEGHVLIVGMALVLLYILWLFVQLIVAPDTFQTLLGMTATEVVFGRVACMAFGYSMDLNHTQVILISMFLETLLVMIFYPLFVFIWRQLLVIKWLKKVSERTRRAAEKRQGFVRRYGIIGLFMFVWFPFWMTGPVVGCMIGYLLGMRVWVNLTTVLFGTYVAILGWAYLLYQLHQQTVSYSSYAIVIAAAVIAAVMLTLALRQRFSKNHKPHSEEP